MHRHAASIRGMEQWIPAIVEVKCASNEALPGSRSRGEVGILEVGSYRKVVLATPAPTRRRGTFFSITA